ncbi:MAG: 2-hydroxyacid dehydrogenase [Bacteroidota bacterium]|nr:2-hydroxyacid dehydrogenase [Bacteroidota bacterium]
MKIVFYSTRDFERPFFDSLNYDSHDIVYLRQTLTKETVEMSNGADAIFVFPNDDCSKEIIESLHQLGVKYISTRSKGFDHIDWARANELGVIVGRVPDYSPYSVAEHAIALLLSLNRRTFKAYNLSHKWDFRLDNLMGFDVHKKVVGVIGVGKIGSVMVKILKGFGCKVIAYDPVRYQFLVDSYDLEYVDTIEDLYSRSEIITIHAPLNEQTHYMIDKKSISKMKKGVMIINTARGGIVNTKDIIWALREGIVSAYGADVYENERDYFFSDCTASNKLDGTLEELISIDNVLITSHQGSLTEKAMEDIARASFHNVNCWSKGNKSGNELN